MRATKATARCLGTDCPNWPWERGEKSREGRYEGHKGHGPVPGTDCPNWLWESGEKSREGR